MKVAEKMKTIKTALLVCGVVAASLVLGACREAEKGNYAGKPDTQISEDARRALMDRIHYQGGLDTPGGSSPGISGVSSSADVRPPEPRK